MQNRDSNALIPPGTYRLVLLEVETFRRFGQNRWCAYFAVVGSSEHEGTELPLFLNPPRGKHLSPDSKLAATWVVATGERPPRNLGERDPTEYLAGHSFEARVVTVSQDPQKQGRPRQLHYSKIDRLLRRLTPDSEEAP